MAKNSFMLEAFCIITTLFFATLIGLPFPMYPLNLLLFFHNNFCITLLATVLATAKIFFAQSFY